jgi:triphosphatase
MARPPQATTAGPVEVEWQFDALDLRPVERFAAAGTVAVSSGAGIARLAMVPQTAQRLQDTYLDTADWRLGRAGLVLRIRNKRGRREATIKDQKPAEDGLRTRLEITEALPGGELVPSSDGGPVSSCIWSLARDRPLEVVCDVTTRRRPFELRLGGEVIGELALDDTTIDVGPGQSPLRLHRVEVEVDIGSGSETAWPAAEAFVERLRHDCGLRPASLSKFEAGLLALGVEIPGKEDFGATGLPEPATVGDVAYVAVRRALGAMLLHEPGTRLGTDAEELHQMRVATRHMRAVLGIFATAFPVRAQQLRTEIGWLAAILGDVRDLDVQLEQLDGWIEEAPPTDAGALGELGAILAAQRRAARAELLVALDSQRYERLVARLGEMLRSGPSSRLTGARMPAMEVVDAIAMLQAKAAKAARRAGRSGLPADYHQLRIRCKRLRYALEYVSDVYDGKIAMFRKQIVTLQTVLGELQDAEVASARLRTMAGAEESAPMAGPDLKPAAIFVMGELAERYNERARQLLAALPSKLRLVKGPEWTNLRSLMEDKRAVADVPPPSPPQPRQPRSAAARAVRRTPTPVPPPQPRAAGARAPRRRPAGTATPARTPPTSAAVVSSPRRSPRN